MKPNLLQRITIYSVNKPKRRLCFLFACMGAMACSEPFEVDRHDLIAPRILGLRHVNDGIEVQVWNGWGAYHQTRPLIEWLDDNSNVLNNSVNLEVDPSLKWSITDGETLPSVVQYTDSDGGVHRATFELVSSSVALTAQVYQLPTVNDFTLDARLEQEGSLLNDGLASDAIRIAMQVDGNSLETSKVRWMTANGVGTFLERSALETDFFRANVLMDRDELLENTPIDADKATLFALYIDGQGGNQWTWMDVLYSDVPRVRHNNRWLVVDALPDDGTGNTAVSAELYWDETVEDWELVNLSADVRDAVIPDCAPTDAESALYFQWEWLELGYCTIEDVNGSRIALEIEQ